MKDEYKRVSDYAVEEGIEGLAWVVRGLNLPEEIALATRLNATCVSLTIPCIQVVSSLLSGKVLTSRIYTPDFFTGSLS